MTPHARATFVVLRISSLLFSKSAFRTTSGIHRAVRSVFRSWRRKPNPSEAECSRSWWLTVLKHDIMQVKESSAMAGTGSCVESDLNFQTETIVPTTAGLVI